MRNRRNAFTLLELVVVLFILGVLLLLIVPRVYGYMNTANETAARYNANAVMEAAELKALDLGSQGKSMQGTYQYTGVGENPLAKYLNRTKGKKVSYKVQINDMGEVIDGDVQTGDVHVKLPDLEIQK